MKRALSTLEFKKIAIIALSAIIAIFFFIRNLFSFFFQFSLLVDFFVRAPLPHGGNIITTLR